MSIIKSTEEGAPDLYVGPTPIPSENVRVWLVDPEFGGSCSEIIRVPTADLAAALGLPTFEEVGEKDCHAGSPYRYKIAYEHWRGRALEHRTERGEWKARAEDAEAESLEQAKLVRMWADRAEEAVATIERVKAVIEQSSTVDCAEIWIAIEGPEPKPELPTRSGALIVVEGLPAEDGPVTLALHDDGRWYYLTGTSYYPADRVARADWKLAHITTA